MCRNQVRNICVFRPIILLQRRIHLAFERPVPYSRKIHSVGQRTSLRAFLGGAHPSLAIGIMMIFGSLFSIGPGGGWAGEIAVRVVSPGDAVEVVVLIHQFEGGGGAVFPDHDVNVEDRGEKDRNLRK